MRAFYFLVFLVLAGCISTQSTLKNIDNKSVRPNIMNDAFAITERADTADYGYNPDYPVNIGVVSVKSEEVYAGYFFKGLQGKNGERVYFQKIETCCPFPTKSNQMGAGTLSVYEVWTEGSSKKAKLYLNIYERGKIMCPIGFNPAAF